MKILRTVLTTVFALLGVQAAALALFLAFSNLDSSPVLMTPALEARSRVEKALDAVSQGDYETIGQMMAGTPDLGVDRAASNRVTQLVWDSFLDSFTYKLGSNCYATDSGVAQDVRITCLDMSSITVNLRQYAQETLAQKVADAEDTSQIYDENNEYREDVVMEALYEATQKAIATDGKYMTLDFTINLLYQDGVWLLVPDGALLKAISGSLIK